MNKGRFQKKKKLMEFSIKLARTPPNPPHHSPSGLPGWGYQEG